VLSSNQPLPDLVRTLITTALDQGSRDNITALVVRCSGPQ
jgi:serine/threonine protein phosphatase PrpC